MNRLWQNAAASARRAALPGALAILGILVLVTAIHTWQTNRLQTDPQQGAAIETHNLLTATGHMESDLNNANVITASNRYLKDISAMSRACDRLEQYGQTAIGTGANQQESQHFKEADQLCRDLTKLTGYSSTVTTASLPLLRSSTTPHRFETIWPISAALKNQHLKETTSALATLSSRVPDSIGFPSRAVPELKQLREAIQTGAGFHYLANLQSFQLQMAGERRQFWLDFGHLSALKRAITAQQATFCRSLHGGRASFCD